MDSLEGAADKPDDSTNAAESRTDGLPPVSPDFIEQDWPEEIDNIVPTRGYQMTPMVGVGGQRRPAY